jgi:hypothetical protein
MDFSRFVEALDIFAVRLDEADSELWQYGSRRTVPYVVRACPRRDDAGFSEAYKIKG